MFRQELFSPQRLSYFPRFLSCSYLSRRSSASSFVTKRSPQGRTSSISQYQSIGPLLNTETNISQVNFFIKEISTIGCFPIVKSTKRIIVKESINIF